MSSVREVQATHGRLLKTGLRELNILWNNLLKGYSDLGCPQEARQVFAEMPQKDAFTWNIIILSLARCGRFEEARRLFDENSMRCTISWNCMMSAYNFGGRHLDVLKLFVRMHQECSSRSGFSFVTVLNACSKLPVRELSKQVHADIIRRGLSLNHMVGSALIRVYSAHNMLLDAWQAFQDVKYRDGVLWTSIISAHAQNQMASLHSICSYQWRKKATAQASSRLPASSIHVLR